MKAVGLLGVNWESTIAYEHLINQEVRSRVGGMHSADLLVRSYNFATIERMQHTGDWHGAGALLAADAKWLQDGGAELIAICSNTMHLVAPAVEAAIDVPLLHAADATAGAAHMADVTAVGLLGTRYTMEHDAYRDRLASHGLEVVVPDEPDRSTLHEIIYDELVRGVVRDASRAVCLSIIHRLRTRGADGVIAACTQIEVLVGASDVPIPYFPTTVAHGLAVVDAALAQD
jgi:aspartate racemase